jgi:methionyl-tRNA formyltransferase
MSYKKKYSIGYFADGTWAINTFRKLIKDKEIIIKFICLRYGKTDQKLYKIAKKNKIKTYIFKDVNHYSNIDNIKKANCDLIVSMSYDQIFRNKLIKHYQKSIINCHAGNLPFYRGRNILNWALINDEKEFGVTVHFINKKIDAGDIIIQKKYPITDKDDYSTLLKICNKECPELLYKSIKMIQNKTYNVVKQNQIDLKGSYFRKRGASDENINWKQSSRKIFNFVRAICKPGPIARGFNKKKIIYIHKVKDLKNIYKLENVRSGTIVKILNSKPIVKVMRGYIMITRYSSNFKLSAGMRFDSNE